jgi:F-type H+-transporting ATPase subunit delta
MIAGALGRRYAKALFALALSQRSEEATEQALQALLEAYRGTPLSRLLTNPALPLAKRKALLAEIARAGGASPLLARFLEVLLERRRLPLLPSIASHYRRLYNDHRGRVDAQVTSADGLDAAAEEHLKQALARLSGKEVLLQAKSDPELLGGLVVEIEGKTYDGSVRTQIRRLRQRIARGS